MKTTLRPTLFSGIFALVLLPACIGCVPPAITWLPDSSGFVYPSGPDGNRLVHFDLEKGTQQTLVADTGTRTHRLALSPDGQTLAVARIGAAEGKPLTMQVIVYDRQGKEQRSEIFFWAPAKENATGPYTVASQLFWSPKGDRLLIQSFDEQPHTGIYDLKADRLVSLQAGQLLVFAGTPIRPDGTCFLLARDDGNNGLQVALVDWDGKEQAVDMKPDSLDTQEKCDLLKSAEFYSSSWEGATAMVTHAGLRIRIDTRRGLGTLETLPREESLVDGKPIRTQFQFPGTSLIIRVLEFTEENNGKAETYLTIETFDARTNDRRTVVAKASSAGLHPAPNQKLVALRCLIPDLDNREREMILVVNNQGNVQAAADVRE